MVYLQFHLHIKSFHWDYFTSSSQQLSEGDKAGILMLEKKKVIVTNFCCCSVPKSCPTLCNPMDWSTTGFLVLHYLLEFAQIHAHWVGDAIQPSHPLSSPSSPTFNLSQHQGLFQWVDFTSGGQSIEASVSASILPMNIQGWFPLGFTGLISLLSKGLSRVFSSTTVWKHQKHSS